LHELDAFENTLASDTDPSLPPTPQPTLPILQARAREGIRRALNDPHAKEKSPEQLELLCKALEGQEDVIAIIPTGGGKSLVWDATALVEPGSASVVMVPYKALLDQHLQTSLSRGIIAYKHVADTTTPPDNFQISYIQPETGRTVKFQQYVA
jgi:superfamily II DNA or RNA helicase